LMACRRNLKIQMTITSSADHSGRAAWDMKCFRRLKHSDRVFECQSKHGCLCLFCLCCTV
jgi:hypothetical protein